LVPRGSGTTLGFILATSILGTTMGSSISVVRACVSWLTGATSSRVVALVRWLSNTRSFLDGDEGSGCFPWFTRVECAIDLFLPYFVIHYSVELSILFIHSSMWNLDCISLSYSMLLVLWGGHVYISVQSFCVHSQSPRREILNPCSSRRNVPREPCQCLVVECTP
jgi:hypothetical protein